MKVGIESINFYGGPAYIDMRELFRYRGLDIARFDTMLVEKKSVGLPCEDSVSNAVNAAKPLIEQLSAPEQHSIEMIITCSASGVDFGKSISTYVHDYLGLSRRCRLFEVKQACYGGTAGLQMASAYVASGVSPGAKVLVIATHSARPVDKYTYVEATQAVGAVAMIISDKPQILALDFGINGFYGYESMDTCIPEPSAFKPGNTDPSLASYLNCLEKSYLSYVSKYVDKAAKANNLDFRPTLDYLAIHSPFAGMAKRVHREMMKKQGCSSAEHIASDFERRVLPSLYHSVNVGNVHCATVYLALCGVIDSAPLEQESRIGIFSYGDGCSSEFYSGKINAESKRELAKMNIAENLANRLQLSSSTYDEILDLNLDWAFGTRDKNMDFYLFREIYEKSMVGKGYLVLNKVSNYHREYIWS